MGEKQDSTPLLESPGPAPSASRVSSPTSPSQRLVLATLLAACGLLAFRLQSLWIPITRPSASRPIVALDYGTFRGHQGIDGVSSFLGVPFAQPPVGPLRFKHALVPPNPLDGLQDASSYGPSCTQVRVTNGQLGGIPSELLDRVEALPNFQVLNNDSEDCLTINIQAPSTIPAEGLPVLVWIYGGGFELGGTSTYDGASIVARSVSLGSPIIYVSMNYRLGGFGFLASQEIKDAGVGNLGLDDQRAALRWVQRYISKFGGDPSKVTIWGESAGAISAALQMVTNQGNVESLFRGAFMQSGSTFPAGDITNGQKEFDAITLAVGCVGPDKVDCLRRVPYPTLRAAIDAKTRGIFAYNSLNTAWRPRVDGRFLTDSPMELVARGEYAKIPIVTGDCDDEGTLFSLSSVNVTTNAQARTYINENYLPAANASEMDSLFKLYPRDPTLGSPFDTGVLNQLTPQFKRLAAFAGDLVFQAPRRYFLSFAADTQDTWAFLYKRGKFTPFLGSFHSSELFTEGNAPAMVGLDKELMDYLINFCVHLNPNPETNTSIINWPQWKPTNPDLLTFLDRPSGGLRGLAIGSDTYRRAAMEYLSLLSLKHPL